ncbi:MAG: nitrous oxide-stimulated promoter family protein [Thermodesulfobacteriota bacterium]|nr:nitrous oxide-stimulated promoter family protein [Thermodesulfobacteriota bacterium]
MKKNSRIQREKKTIEVMIRHYCRLNHHHNDELCPECDELLAYARKRLDKCPFQNGKTTCGKCPVHCYRPDKRETIRKVMRAIGPRMLLTNPIMGIRHVIDGLRKKPIKKVKGRR